MPPSREATVMVSVLTGLTSSGSFGPRLPAAGCPRRRPPAAAACAVRLRFRGRRPEGENEERQQLEGHVQHRGHVQRHLFARNCASFACRCLRHRSRGALLRVCLAFLSAFGLERELPVALYLAGGDHVVHHAEGDIDVGADDDDVLQFLAVLSMSSSVRLCGSGWTVFSAATRPRQVVLGNQPSHDPDLRLAGVLGRAGWPGLVFFELAVEHDDLVVAVVSYGRAEPITGKSTPRAISACLKLKTSTKKVINWNTMSRMGVRFGSDLILRRRTCH